MQTRWISSLFILFSCFGLDAQRKEVLLFADSMCAPGLHGRGYVNGGDTKAASFIETTFKTIGLSPINGTYIQDFKFSVNTFPDSCRLTIGTSNIQPGEGFLVHPSSGSAFGEFMIKELSREDVFQDYVKLTRYIETLPSECVIVVNSTKYKGDSLKIVRKQLLQIANYRPLIELVNEKFTWSVSQNQQKYAYLQLQDTLYENPTLVNLAVNNLFIQHHQARNVMGYLPATKPTKKTLLVSAHYDHLGRMGSSCYFPGANDNASGTAMLVELALRMKEKKKRKFNVLFVAFAGEEVGLLGSAYMVKHPPVPLTDIRFQLNLDIMGSGEEGITAVNATLFPKEFKRLVKFNKKWNAVSIVKPRGPAANSDHYFFTEAGVPAFFIYTMGPNKHYHDIFDTYDELSFKAFESLAILFESFLLGF